VNHDDSKHDLNHKKHDTEAEGAGIERTLHDPISDKLVPLEPLDLSKIKTVDDMVRAMVTATGYKIEP